MYINDNLKKIQDTLNETPCPECGHLHRVGFSVGGTDFSPVTIMDFSDDACDGFIKYVNEYLKQHADDIMTPTCFGSLL